MTRLAPVFVGFVLIGACATTEKPIASTVPGPASVAQPESVGAAPQEPGPTQVTKKTEIQVIDIPPVEQSEVAIAKSNASKRVCRRERRTGTHRAVRVCRTRAEMEQSKQESKDTFRDLHREQSLSDMVDPTGRH